LGAIPAAALDPNIATLGEIPQPPLMGNVDPSKIDEIRRTVYVGNLNSQVTKKKPSNSPSYFLLKILLVDKVLFPDFLKRTCY
jgi:RNA recognition motif-containing protein